MENNPLDFMKMIQGLQKQMGEMQGKLSEIRVTGTAGGNMVQVEVTGNMEVTRVTLDPAVVDPSERAVLEDLIAAAVGDALRKVRDTLKQQVGGGGLNLPPSFLGA